MSPPDSKTLPEHLPAMSDADLKRLREFLKPEIRRAQGLLAHVEREQKNRRRRRACH